MVLEDIQAAMRDHHEMLYAFDWIPKASREQMELRFHETLCKVAESVVVKPPATPQ